MRIQSNRKSILQTELSIPIHLTKEMPYMAANTVNDIHMDVINDPILDEEELIGCSIGIMAYNEEANIARTLKSVLEQTGPSIRIDEVIVVASGCTDRTVPIVAAMALQEPRIH